jgi:rubrerythrin
MSTRTDARALRTRNEERCLRLLAKSELLDTSGLDWTQAGAVELDAGVLDTLVYMRDVEGFTDSYVVGIGAHRTTLGDPIISAFLEVWQAEEAEHSAAIGRFLQHYGEQRDIAIPAVPPSPTPTVPRHERVLMRIGGSVGRLVAAAHMTWGAANELLTMNGYRMLADQVDHPMLADLLRRIAAQESRHYSFYLLQAEWRLADSRLARTVISRIMDGSWTPVGVGHGYKTSEEFQRVLAVLNARPESERIIDRMDRRFAQLPGLERLRIYRTAAIPATS